MKRLPALPGGARLWVSLASGGFVVAALLGHGRQLLQLSLDGQGWCWLLLKGEEILGGLV